MSKKMTAVILAIVFFLAAAGLVVWYFVVFGHANPQLRTDQLRIGSATWNVEIASTTAEQARGLSFRESLASDTGMLFIFDKPSVQHFWMKDMNFPLDMIWIGGGKVLGFVQDAQPKSGAALLLSIYNSPDGTDKVLEVNAGSVAKFNIKEGDAVEIGQIQ